MYRKPFGLRAGDVYAQLGMSVFWDRWASIRLLSSSGAGRW